MQYEIRTGSRVIHAPTDKLNAVLTFGQIAASGKDSNVNISGGLQLYEIAGGNETLLIELSINDYSGHRS